MTETINHVHSEVLAMVREADRRLREEYGADAAQS